MAARAKKLSECLHPRLATWFHETFGDFTQAQLLCVPVILDRQSILLTSPTARALLLPFAHRTQHK
jgi:Lhr-like helicase